MKFASDTKKNISLKLIELSCSTPKRISSKEIQPPLNYRFRAKKKFKVLFRYKNQDMANKMGKKPAQTFTKISPQVFLFNFRVKTFFVTKRIYFHSFFLLFVVFLGVFYRKHSIWFKLFSFMFASCLKRRKKKPGGNYSEYRTPHQLILSVLIPKSCWWKMKRKRNKI